MIRAFGKLIVELYPTTFKSVRDLRKLPVVVRDTNVPILGALSLDAQVSGNSPAAHAGAPLGIHFDATNALWAGLFVCEAKMTTR